MTHVRDQLDRGRRRLLALGGAAALAPLGAGLASPEIGAIMREFRRAYMALDTRGLAVLMAPDVVFSDPTFAMKASGLAELRQLMAKSAEGLAGIEIEVEHEIIADPWAVVRQRQIVGLTEPAGARISVQNVSLFRIAGGRIAEWHDYADALGFQRQLAAIRGKKG
jgi:limonene-1,2-epoxide hydrolase